MNASDPPNSDERSDGRFGIAVAAAAVLILMVAGLLMPVPFKGRTATAIGDLVHAPLFGGVTLAALALLQRRRPLRGVGSALAIRSALLSVGIFTFSVVMEWLQSTLSRTASLHDAIANGLGILAAVSWFWSRSLQRYQPQQTWLRRALLINCGFLLAIAWWRPLVVLRDVAAVQLDFPLLASFESPAELQRFYFRECTGRLTRYDVTEGDRALEITYQATSDPGATLVELRPDWSRMKTLELDVTLDASAAGDIHFMVQVLDRLTQPDGSDSYHREWKLEPGKRQHICIERAELLAGPDTRALDLTQIQYVDLLILEPGQEVTLCVDAIRLTVE